MVKETIAHVESPARSVRLYPARPTMLIQNRTSDDHNGAEKGHVEQVNLHNNVSAKYVFILSLIAEKNVFVVEKI